MERSRSLGVPVNCVFLRMFPTDPTASETICTTCAGWSLLCMTSRSDGAWQSCSLRLTRLLAQTRQLNLLERFTFHTREKPFIIMHLVGSIRVFWRSTTVASVIVFKRGSAVVIGHCDDRDCHRLQKECQSRRHGRSVFSGLTHNGRTSGPALTTQLAEDLAFFSVSTRGLDDKRTV